MRLYEIENVPSPKLLAAAKAWIKGWGLVIPRERIEKKVLAVKNEAMQFVRKEPKILYRGLSDYAMEKAGIDEQKLLNGETLSVTFPRLASWTYYLHIAEDFSEGGIVVKMPSTKLKPILDILAIVKFLPSPTKKDNQDYLQYARREGEIICEHEEPILISKENIAVMHIDGKWVHL